MGSAQCAEKGTGEVLSRDKIVFQSAAPATSLFCFAVYQADTGSTKKKYDKDMLMAAFAKRKGEGTWFNTGMYQQAWKAISAAGTYKAYDWTVKADCDAGFFPDKLVNRIKLMP